MAWRLPSISFESSETVFTISWGEIVGVAFKIAFLTAISAFCSASSVEDAVPRTMSSSFNLDAKASAFGMVSLLVISTLSVGQPLFGLEGYGSLPPRRKIEGAQGDISSSILYPAPPWRLRRMMSEPLELTTRFAAISTAETKGPTRLSPIAAAERAGAHLRYIDRCSAVVGRVVVGIPGGSLEAQRKALRRKIAERSKKGGKRGTRVAERVIFSLPNDLNKEQEAEILSAILKRLIPADSEAAGWGVIHGDKPNNRHCHLLLIDGRESREAALIRKPDAKRVRRADVLRMGEMGRPKELRKLIADEINRMASQNASKGVEWRSFKERGIQRPPTRHKGPRRLAQAAREAVSSVWTWLATSMPTTPLSELFSDPPEKRSFLDEIEDDDVISK
ncbi:MobA/MobL family protein, partial [Sulfitobacter pontiacus]|uniref:MobA/MobL family protein n=1 Tax=Sulfitobacter pontiacus TaxID=60137 RepID=UPI0030EF050C